MQTTSQSSLLSQLYCHIPESPTDGASLGWWPGNRPVQISRVSSADTGGHKAVGLTFKRLEDDNHDIYMVTEQGTVVLGKVEEDTIKLNQEYTQVLI